MRSVHLLRWHTVHGLPLVTYRVSALCICLLSYYLSHRKDDLANAVWYDLFWSAKCVWTGRSGDRIPVGGENFRSCPDRSWGPPSLLYNGYQVSFLGVKRPGREVIERVQLYFYHLRVFKTCSRVSFTFSFNTKKWSHCPQCCRNIYVRTYETWFLWPSAMLFWFLFQSIQLNVLLIFLFVFLCQA